MHQSDSGDLLYLMGPMVFGPCQGGNLEKEATSKVAPPVGSKKIMILWKKERDGRKKKNERKTNRVSGIVDEEMVGDKEKGQKHLFCFFCEFSCVCVFVGWVLFRSWGEKWIRKTADIEQERERKKM